MLITAWLTVRRARRTRNDAAVRIGLARDQFSLDIPRFRGFGQFSLYILSLGKQADRARFQQRLRKPSSSVSGASARAVTTSNGVCESCGKILDSLAHGQWPGSASAATASRRKAAFLALLSTRWTSAPGVSGERAGDHQARESRRRSRDRSSVCASGASAQELQRIGDMARPDLRQRRGATRLMRCCHVEQQLDEALEPRRCFT